MFVEDVPVIEDGTINGRVFHQTILPSPPVHLVERLSVSSAGIGHPKHGGDKGPGAAGQDVYGHTERSIYVADGHGQEGLAAARATIGVVSELESLLNPGLLARSPERMAQQFRERVVDYMHRVLFPKSGATFTQMIFVSDRGRRWAITINVGDSEALLVYKNKIQLCSVAHVWENKDMYQRYISNSRIQKPVCYNRWNASDYRLRGPSGSYRPIMLYNVKNKKVSVHKTNAEWMSGLWNRRNKPSLRFGTQSVRMPAEPHENWGSCVLVGGRARGQVMATFGDVTERRQTGVPLDMVHVYVHEIPFGQDVIGVVQSDGISNSRTLLECGKRAWTYRSASEYIKGIQKPRDDMSVGIACSLVSKRGFHV